MKLGNPFGISIFVHWTFGLLLGWIGLTSLFQAGLGSAMISMFLIIALFGCVVLHELGHSLAARAFGIGTLDITLYPIGGVAKLARMPRDPVQELIIALAGPAVNVGIAILLVPVALLIGLPQWSAGAVLPATLSEFVFTLLSANIFLVLFNLVPAFPMDGGRVLRAFLAMRVSYVKATNIAARIGQGLAIAFGLLGLVTFNLLWMILAAFVFFAAGAERRMAMWQQQFGGFEGPPPVPRPTPDPRTVVIQEDDWDVLPPDEVIRRSRRW